MSSTGNTGSNYGSVHDDPRLHNNSHIHGTGTWQTGTVVREIEGHFHKENEPQGAAPISSTGGVPEVDYSLKDRVEDKLTHGRHSEKEYERDQRSGLTHGSGSSGIGSSGYASNTSGLEHSTDGRGVAQRAEGAYQDHNNNSSSSTGKQSLVQKAENLISGNKSSSHDSTTGTSGLDSHSNNYSSSNTGLGSGAATGLGAGAPSGLGSHGHQPTGPTSGISDVAQRELEQTRATPPGSYGGATGHEQSGLSHTGSQGSYGQNLPSQTTGERTGGAGMAQRAEHAIDNRTGDSYGSGVGRTGDVGTTGHSSTTGTHGTTTSGTHGTHGTHGAETGEHKEGFLSKVKHALSG